MTTNNNAATIATIATIRNAASAVAAILNAPTQHTAQQRMDAETALQNALNKANTAKLEEIYTSFDKTENPLQAFTSVRAWNPYIVRKTTDRTSRQVSYSIMNRRQRLSILDYLKHAEDQGITLPTPADVLRDLLDSACTTLSAYVLSCIRSEDVPAVSISNVKAGLYNFMSKLNVPSLKVRNTDVRFLAMAVTRARDLGELAEIDASHVAPYLMDMIYAQAHGIDYGFASKEAKKEEPSK